MKIRSLFTRTTDSHDSDYESNQSASAAEEMLIRRCTQAVIDFPDQAPIFEAVATVALDEDGMQKARYDIGVTALHETLRQLAQSGEQV